MECNESTKLTEDIAQHAADGLELINKWNHREDKISGFIDGACWSEGNDLAGAVDIEAIRTEAVRRYGKQSVVLW
jgi:hypothetical protein